MNRRRIVCVVAIGIFVTPSSSWSQLQGKVWRIGVLDTLPVAQNAANLDAFRDGLRELGYVEGTNLAIEYRSSDGRGERFASLSAELARANVDVIVTRGTPAALAAKGVSDRIPVVMASIGDPLLVAASLSRPGGNITGLTSVSTDLESKRVQLLRELVPNVSRVAALYNMGNPVFARRWDEIVSAARSLGISASLLDVRKTEDFTLAFDAARRQRVEALVVGQDGLMQANGRLIASLAMKHHLPAIYISIEFIDAGGLISYGPHFPDMYRRAANYVDKIFKGAKAGDLPIEQPTRFELVINAKLASTLGLTIPQSLRLLADRLIE
jgi:putative tryptophan/tyrosine transport system substrate-binding protein